MTFGLDLTRLLVVRPVAPERGERESVRTALWATEGLLASGAFEAVAIDIPIERARARTLGDLEGMLRRLRAAAEKGGVVALWLGLPGAQRVPSAAARLELSAGSAGAQVRLASARGAADVPRTEWRETSLFPAPMPGASHAA
jgi:hypothetical protein